jgi:N-acetylmuramoyl-L-alanine amidase
LGNNTFTIRQGKQVLQLQVNRLNTQSQIPAGGGFANSSLSPQQDTTRLVGELVCFSAIAPPNAQVSVQLNKKVLPLAPQPPRTQIPSNAAVLTNTNQSKNVHLTYYQNCVIFSSSENFSKPVYQAKIKQKTFTQASVGSLEIINPEPISVVEIITDKAITRTGAGSDYSRLTPLPKGTKAQVTGKEGEWLRLDYGAWIQAKDTRALPDTVPPETLVRGITSRQLPQNTEIIFPLQNPVPLSIAQEDNKLILTLYNTTAQTDTIALNNDPLISRLDWQQISPKIIQYTFHLKTNQQWGYDYQYRGTNLILTLRHPPQERLKILLDPGHGGKESGARGPTGHPEKTINLKMAQLVEKELVRRGVDVYLTRRDDRDLSLLDRVKMIEEIQPHLALSIHYNALPDNGDALNTKGVGMFWYHPQAHSLAVYLQNYLVTKLNRPTYGVFWNNLALTRPQIAPAILLELGFMTNPQEFEWITNPQSQQQLAQQIAEGVIAWINGLVNYPR